jgi:hypothetical protein
MEKIPPHIKVLAYCPVCETPLPLTHKQGEDFVLQPVEAHIVQAHPDMKGNKHVPNIRIQWEVRATD